MTEDQSNKKKKETPLFVWFVVGCLVSTGVQKALIELTRSGNAADLVIYKKAGPCRSNRITPT